MSTAAETPAVRVQPPPVPGTPHIGSFGQKTTANCLLVKAELGTVKQTTYTLPGIEHTYGKALFREDEGTGEMIMSWMEHVPNPHAKPGRDFKALNKGAVVAGAVTPKQQNYYRKTHDARLKIGTHEDRKFTLADGFIHGKSTRPSTPMNDLISSAYRWSWVAEHLEQEEGAVTPANKGSKPVDTKASRGHALAASSATVPRDAKAPFVMKRFRDVPAKVVNYQGPRQRPDAARATPDQAAPVPPAAAPAGAPSIPLQRTTTASAPAAAPAAA